MTVEDYLKDMKEFDKLPEWVQKLVLEEQALQNCEDIIGDISDRFSWPDSRQGRDSWENIYYLSDFFLLAKWAQENTYKPYLEYKNQSEIQMNNLSQNSQSYQTDDKNSSCSVDCLNSIVDLLVFESEDDFYFLQILQRKKENAELGSNSRVIKNYYITSVQYLLDRYDEIKALCNLFNARASLRLNKRSFEKVGFKSLENIANTMQNRDYKHLMNSYDRACGLLNNEKNKKWIVDIDKNEVKWIEQIINIVQLCDPIGNKILKKLPTKSGIHLITTPFNVLQFQENLKKELEPHNIGEINIDIHKDNPINLYIPKV